MADSLRAYIQTTATQVLVAAKNYTNFHEKSGVFSQSQTIFDRFTTSLTQYEGESTIANESKRNKTKKYREEYCIGVEKFTYARWESAL